MDKWQAIHSFWSGFGIPAYDQTDVPDDAVFPYITYAASISNFENTVQLTASIWYRSTSWASISQKAQQIADSIAPFKIIPINNGYLHIVQGRPFAQRMEDPDGMIRRIYVILQAEFFTNS